jgi:hypothetical protein
VAPPLCVSAVRQQGCTTRLHLTDISRTDRGGHPEEEGAHLVSYLGMLPGHKRLALNEGLLSLWERLVAMLGIHTTRVLLQRAIGQTAQCHPALDLIRHDDSGLSSEALKKSHATWSEEESEAAFTDLGAARPAPRPPGGLLRCLTRWRRPSGCRCRPRHARSTHALGFAGAGQTHTRPPMPWRCGAVCHALRAARL